MRFTSMIFAGALVAAAALSSSSSVDAAPSAADNVAAECDGPAPTEMLRKRSFSSFDYPETADPRHAVEKRGLSSAFTVPFAALKDTGKAIGKYGPEIGKNVVQIGKNVVNGAKTRISAGFAKAKDVLIPTRFRTKKPADGFPQPVPPPGAVTPPVPVTPPPGGVSVTPLGDIKPVPPPGVAVTPPGGIPPSGFPQPAPPPGGVIPSAPPVPESLII